MIRAFVIAAALLAVPALAYADPITIAGILTSAFVGSAAVKALIYVGLLVYGSARARRKARSAQAKARAEYNASLQDRSVTALQALPVWRITPGRAISGGDIHAIFTTDKTGYREDGSTYTRPDALKHLVVVFDDHEDHAIHEYYIDGVAVGPLDGSGFVTAGEFFSSRVDSRTATIGGGGSVTVGQAVVTVLNAYVYTGSGDGQEATDVAGSVSLSGGNLTINGPAGAIVNYTVQANLPSVRIQTHLGTSSQAVDTYLNSILPNDWTSTDRLLNKSYAVITLDLENQRFQGAPPGIMCDRSGRKVYDPRKDSTVAGGSGSHRSNDPATWEWSDNPALAVRDYLTAEWGVAAAHADVNDAFTIAAANACDARVTPPVHSQAFTANAGTDLITFASAEIYATGDGVQVTSSGTPPAPLVSSIVYYAIRVSNTTFKLATSKANALAGTAIDITSTGSGTHTATAIHAQEFTADASANTITFPTDEIYTVGDGVRLGTTGTLPAPLATSTTYYAIKQRDHRTYKLATSVANAYAGTAIDLTTAGSGAHLAVLHDYATFKCNGVFSVDDGQREAVLEDLAESMGGNAVYGAQWEIVPAAWAATVMDLTDDDLAGQIEIVQADTPLEQLINGVRGTFIPAGKSVPLEFDNYSNASAVTDDGAEHWADVALPFVDTKVRARNLARILVETNRNGQIIRYPAKLKAWPLQRGDRVRVSSTEYGFSLKTFRVTDWQDAANAVLLTLQEDAAAAYDLADQGAGDQTPNTGLGSPWVVQGITIGTITSGSGVGYRNAGGTWVPRVKVPWTAVTDPYLADGAGRIVVVWRTPRDLTTWQRMELPSNETSALLEGVREGDFIVVEVYARNALGQVGASSFASHEVEFTGNGELGGGNLLANSSFEVDSNADGVPDHWTGFNNGTVGSITYAVSSATYQPVHGTKYLSVSCTNLGTGTGDQVGIKQTRNLSGYAGHRMVLSVFAQGGGGGTPNLRLTVQWYDAINGGGSLVSTEQQVFADPPGAFTRHVLPVNAPASALSAIVYINMEDRASSGAAAMLFDGAQFEPGAVPTQFAPRADELLPGVVTTPIIAPNAATNVGWDEDDTTTTDVGDGDSYDLLTLTFTPDAAGTVTAFASFDAESTAGAWTGTSYGTNITIEQDATTTDGLRKGLKSSRITQAAEVSAAVVAGELVTIKLIGVAPEGFTTSWYSKRLQYELVKR